MRTLEVDLGERSYPIHIGPGLIEQAELIRPHVQSRQVMVVTNETVAPLYLEKLEGALQGLDVHATILPDGEQFKTLETSEQIFESLLKVPCDRRVTMIALGGGVVGDICGFAAGCYQRGVPFIQVPTTLLAQVDSSVGGKTAVNSRLGKNMIGLFYQPRCVIADTATLRTLPARELSAGAAEVIKTALIRDPAFFAWLEQNIDSLLNLDDQVITWAVEQCCRIKAAVVAEDEQEHGVRALLNLGHTFGHAIETGMGHGAWLHGEAVGAGMCMAADLSRRLGLLGKNDQDRISRLIEQAGLPVRGPGSMDAARMIELMKVDKKVQDNVIRLVLLRGIGDADVVSEYPPAQLESCIEELKGSQ